MISEKERKQKWIFVNIIISATIFSVFSIPHAHLRNICITSCSHHIINTLHTDIPQLMMGFSSVQFSCSVMSDSLLLHGLQNARIPVQLLALAQTHVHWVSDVIQPSCPLLSSSPPAFNLSQHQSLFQWVCTSYQVAKVLELQHKSLQWIFRVDFL